MSIRLLPMETLTGPGNMAADEALLRSATAGVASLRFYSWTAPTLSLGYFQAAEVRHHDPRLAQLPWVRRATGGAALVHDQEVTYALALPAGAPWHDPTTPWSCRFHHIVIDALQGAGAKTRPVVCGQERKLGEVLCFLHQTAGDLLADGAKVVGSAQRKQKGALLQHGGILLKQSPYTPQLPGIFERTGIAFTPAEVAERVTRQFNEVTGWSIVPGTWTEEELAWRQEIEAERYGSPAWNEKR